MNKEAPQPMTSQGPEWLAKQAAESAERLRETPDALLGPAGLRLKAIQSNWTGTAPRLEAAKPASTRRSSRQSKTSSPKEAPQESSRQLPLMGVADPEPGD